MGMCSASVDAHLHSKFDYNQSRNARARTHMPLYVVPCRLNNKNSSEPSWWSLGECSEEGGPNQLFSIHPFRVTVWHPIQHYQLNSLVLYLFLFIMAERQPNSLCHCVTVLTLWCPLLPYGTAIKHPVPDQLKMLFAIFDIRALWC